jgi:hypothetical protein
MVNLSIFELMAEGEGFRTLETGLARLAAFKTVNIWLCRAKKRLLAPVFAPVTERHYLRVWGVQLARGATQRSCCAGARLRSPPINPEWLSSRVVAAMPERPIFGKFF